MAYSLFYFALLLFFLFIFLAGHYARAHFKDVPSLCLPLSPTCISIDPINVNVSLRLRCVLSVSRSVLLPPRKRVYVYPGNSGSLGRGKVTQASLPHASHRIQLELFLSFRRYTRISYPTTTTTTHSTASHSLYSAFNQGSSHRRPLHRDIVLQVLGEMVM